MKLQPMTLEKELRKLRSAYNKTSMPTAEKEDQDESFFHKLQGFDTDIVEQVIRNYSGKWFPTAGDIVQKCWDLKKKKQESSSHSNGHWNCVNNFESCKTWEIDEKQAAITQKYLGCVVCYLCEQRWKAEQRPGEIEDLWLVQMGFK